jgi:CubicO group peptidase (beta-lactamase class C family)
MNSPIAQNARAVLPNGERLKGELTKLLRATGNAGAAVHITVADEQLVISAGTLSIGGPLPLTKQARFGIACFVRFLVSLVTVKLARQGKIDLDACIGSYLPELGTTGESKGSTILVRHLLTHTGGYRGVDGLRTSWQWPECVKYLENTPQFFTPGKVFSEEHLDHVVLGQILLRVTGRRASDLIQEHVFDPLGICPGSTETDGPELRVFGHSFSNETLRLEKNENVDRETETWAPSLSNMTLTAGDMARLGTALTRDGTDGFPNDIIELACNTGIELPRASCAHQNSNWIPAAFTLCCAKFPTGLYGFFASGYGQCCGVVFDVERRISVGLGLNVLFPLLRARILNLVFEHALDRVDGRFGHRVASEPEPRDFFEFLAPFKPGGLVGRYVGSQRDEVTVALQAGRLKVALGNHAAVTLGALQKNRLMIDSRAPIPVAFFAEPQTRRPCVMIGLNVFKKIA